MATPSVEDLRGEIVALAIIVNDTYEELARSVLSGIFDRALENHGHIVAVGPCLILATFGFPYKDVAQPMKVAQEISEKLHQQFGTQIKILYGATTGRFAEIGSKFPRLIPRCEWIRQIP